MADRRSHARGVQRTDAAKALGDIHENILVEILDHIELDIVAAMAGKAINPVTVADRFQGIHHQHDRFLFHIDDAPLRAFVSGAPPDDGDSPA